MPLRGHRTYWSEEVGRGPDYPSLDGNLATDVVVVGGGISGLTAAWRLRELGRDVALLEMNRIAGGTTGHSTGHLDVTTDRLLNNIARDFGEPAARRLVASSAAAMDFVEELSASIEGSDFRRLPSYLYAEHHASKAALQREWEADRRADLSVELLEGAPLPFETVGALKVEHQARFNPAAYTRGLARKCAEAQCRIYEEVRVKDIEEDDTCRVVTTRGIVTANQVIVAVHGAMLGLVTLSTRAYPYQSYVLGVRVRNDIPDALFWDTSDPYHYTRWAASDDPKLLIIGGADHRTGEQRATEASFAKLEQYVRERYDVESVEFRWSHEVYESADGLPYIGRVPGQQKQFTATAFGGDGLKYGSVAGHLLADLVCERFNPTAELFDPSRIKPVASARRVAAGLSHMAKHFIGDRLVPSDVKHLHEIPMDAGRVLRVDGKRVAVYRDADGEYHAISPVCTHAGCIVHWNNAEKTWDCPCHGGRYDAYGKVIMAPPRRDLHPIDLPAVVTRE